MAEMFRDVVEPPAAVGSKRYTVTLSIALHTTIVLLLIGLSVAASGALPTPNSVIVFAASVAPPVPDIPPPPTPAPPTPQPATEVTAPTPAAAPTATVPIEAPTTIAAPPPITIGSNAGLPDAIAASGAPAVSLPGPPLPAEPVRVGGQIEAPVKLHDAAPVYPPVAQKARVSGTVIVEAIIGVDGRVTSAKVIRSMPLLDQAALDAVKQWTYKPTLLNGSPVPVIMTVTVTFNLKGL